MAVICKPELVAAVSEASGFGLLAMAFAGETIETSWLKGDLEARVLPAGEISGLISDVPAVKEVTEEMIRPSAFSSDPR
jgi:NAD(P)H-dependent flavin oxidoreductase YrpB (nitropropane dioxygenase family)